MNAQKQLVQFLKAKAPEYLADLSRANRGLNGLSGFWEDLQAKAGDALKTAALTEIDRRRLEMLKEQARVEAMINPQKADSEVQGAVSPTTGGVLISVLGVGAAIAFAMYRKSKKRKQ